MGIDQMNCLLYQNHKLSSEDESSESQMWKVMRTEVEELGYWDENMEMTGDRKKCLSYLCVIKKEWHDVFVNLFLTKF